jgi:hypothetical protein
VNFTSDMQPKPFATYLTRQTNGVVVNGDTYEYQFDRHEPPLEDDEWKLDVGEQCNILLEIAQRMLDESEELGGEPSEEDKREAGVIRSIVERVAAVEELDKEAA